MWEYRHTDELYHWGVPGMKWGRRKAKNTTSTTNNTSKNNTTKNNTNNTSNKWSTKKKVAVGTAAVAGALAVYGAIKIKKSDINITDSKSGRKYVYNTITRVGRGKDIPIKFKLNRSEGKAMESYIMNQLLHK